jgi:predicted transcriptional regulator
MNQSDSMLDMTSRIVSSYASRNEMPVADLPAAIRTVHEALVAMSSGGSSRAAPPADGAVPDGPDAALPPQEGGADAEDGMVREGVRTVYDDHLVCLEDRKDVVFLGRHLRRLGVTPEHYRAKWSLPASYPMVAPAYAARKRSLALAAGLGKSNGIRPRTSPGEPVKASAPPVSGRTQRRRRAGTLSPAFG